MDRSRRNISAVFLVAALLRSPVLLAQMDPLEADRPDQTESPAIVPAGWIQVESGAEYEQLNEGGSTFHSASLPVVLTKVGLSRRVELRLVTEHQREQLGGERYVQSGLLPVEVGAKINLWQERGLRPRTSLITHAGLPMLAADRYVPNTAFGTFRFTLQHTLSSTFSLGYNLGMEWDGDSPTAQAAYTLTLGWQALERLGIYVEEYGWVSDRTAADRRFDGGVTFKCGPDVLLDASGGFAMEEARWFVSIGGSFRLPVFAGHVERGY